MTDIEERAREIADRHMEDLGARFGTDVILDGEQETAIRATVLSAVEEALTGFPRPTKIWLNAMSLVRPSEEFQRETGAELIRQLVAAPRPEPDEFGIRPWRQLDVRLTAGTDAVLRAAVDEKQGVKAVREATHALGHAIGGAESNTEFAVKSVSETAEHVVSQARADVEAHILQAAQSGLGYEVQIPELGIQSAPAEPKGLGMEALEAQEHQRRMAEEA